MDVDAFRKAAELGLGRCVVALDCGEPWAKHAAAIGHVCAHITALDPQSEGARGWYACELARRTSGFVRFGDAVVARLLDPAFDDSTWDLYHVHDVALHFARAGHEPARAAVYERYERDAAKLAARRDGDESDEADDEDDSSADELDVPTGGYGLVEFDGIDGLLRIARVVGRLISTGPWRTTSDYLIRRVLFQHRQPAVRALRAAARGDPDVRRYLDAARAFHAEDRKRRAGSEWRKPPMTYAELRARLDADPATFPRSLSRRFGLRADDDELRKAAAAVLVEQDEQKLSALLGAFQLSNSPFPLAPDRLVELAAGEPTRIGGPRSEGGLLIVTPATAARYALAHVPAAGAGELARRLLRAGEQTGDEVIELLTHNYQLGDEALILDALRGANGDGKLHWPYHEALKVFKHNEAADPLPIALEVYERCGCSMARSTAVDLLLERGLAPDWMRAEIAFDSYEGTRESASERQDEPRP